MPNINHNGFELNIEEKEFDTLRDTGEVVLEKYFAGGGWLDEGDIIPVRGDGTYTPDRLTTARVEEFVASVSQRDPTFIVNSLKAIREKKFFGGDYKVRLRLKKV